MCSKHSRRVTVRIAISLLVIALSLTACRWEPGRHLSVGEDNPKSAPMRVNFSNFRCFAELDKSVKLYLDSQLDEKGIDETIGCLQAGFRKFEYLTQDSRKKTYSPGKLAEFINREYLKERQLSPDFVSEIMELKVVVLGGHSQHITRLELRSIIDLIGLIGQMAKENLPYLKIYQRPDQIQAQELSNAQLEAAQKQLRKTGEMLAALLSKNKKNYSVVAFERLLRHSRLFLRWEQLHEDAIPVHQFIEIVLSLKEVVEGERTYQFEAQQWNMLFDVLTSAFGYYINYHLKIKNHTLQYGPSLQSFVRDFESAANLLERVIINSKKEMITFDSLDRLFAALEAAQKLKFGIRAESLKPVYRRLIAYGLRNPVEMGVPRDAEGLDLRKLNELKAEFGLWAKIQLHLSETSRSAMGVRFDQTLGAKDFSVKILSRYDFGESASARLSDPSLKSELEYLKRNFLPFFREDDARIYILPQDEYEAQGFKYDISTLSRLNIYRTFVRIFIRSFANEFNLLKFSGVNQSEVMSFYDTIKSLGQDLKVIDPRKKSGASYFVEGNIFTFSGDGLPSVNRPTENLLSFNETLELLSVIRSGSVVRDQLYSSILEACRKENVKDGDADIFGLPKIDRRCFLKQISKNQFDEFANLPRMKEALNAALSQGHIYKQFLIDIQKLSAIPCENVNQIEKSEMIVMTTALHYVESLFSVYDRNKNNVLETLEVMNAYHRFGNYLDKMVREKINDEYEVSRLKAVYLFIVSKKRFPDKYDMPGIMIDEWKYFDDDPNQFANRRSGASELPEFAITRFDLIRILRLLSESAVSERQKCE